MLISFLLMCMIFQTQLNTIIKNIKSLEERHQDLARENAKLE